MAANIKAFEAANPRIKVKVEVLPPAQIHPQLIQSASAKKTPDVIRLNAFWPRTHAKAGSIESLNAYASEFGDKADWLLDWDHSVLDGEKITMPYDMRACTLQARPSRLKDAGVALPATYDELLDAASKIGPDNPTGLAVGLSKADTANALCDFFVSGVLAAGGTVFDADGKAIFNDEAGVRTFQFIANLYKNKATSKATQNYTYTEVQDGLKSGTVAMAVLVSAVISGVKAGGAGEDYAFSAVPSWQAGGSRPANIIHTSLAMGKYPTDKDAAAKFIAFMTGPDAAVNLAKGGEVPPRKSSFEDPYFSSNEATFVNRIKEIIENDPKAVKFPPAYGQVQEMLAEAAQKMVLQGDSPKAVLDTVVATANTRS